MPNGGSPIRTGKVEAEASAVPEPRDALTGVMAAGWRQVGER
jgi:hypothetical protein